MHERTKEFLMSLSKEEIIEYVDNILKQRNKKKAKREAEYRKLLDENTALKTKLKAISKISEIMNDIKGGK